MTLRADALIELSVPEHAELTRPVRARRTLQALTLRARIVLMTAEQVRPSPIAQALCQKPEVREHGIDYVMRDSARACRSFLSYLTAITRIEMRCLQNIAIGRRSFDHHRIASSPHVLRRWWR